MDDVTIEDEIDTNEQSSSPMEQLTHRSLLYSIINQSWLIVIICSLLTLYWMFWKRRNSREDNGSPSMDSIAQYEQMERIRQRQQKEYEEQTQRRLEEKKAKLEAKKALENETNNGTKYRSTDYNPLTGQSTRNDGGSCSWRPSTARRKAAGG